MRKVSEHLVNVLTILTGKMLCLSESTSLNGTEFSMVLEKRKQNTQ